MARRPRQDDERSMDSLMDAMTNVVGILLLILVVFSLDITKKIDEQLANLPQISEQQLQEMKASRSKTLDNLKALEATFANAKAQKIDPEEATQLALNLEQFEKENEDLTAKTSDLEALLAKTKELEPIKDEKQVRNTAAVTELNQLEQLLASKPALETVEAREISLPDPREADDQAYIYYVACKHQKVYVVGEPYALMTKMRDIIDQNYQELAYSGTELGNYTYTILDPKLNSDGKPQSLKVNFQARTRRDKEAIAYMNDVSVKPWGRDSEMSILQLVMGGNEEQQEEKKEFPFRKMRFDREKIAKFFENNAGKGDFTYIPKFSSDRVRLELKPNETGGISADQLSSSAYVEMVRQAKNSRRTIILFYVAPDSFDIYLRARTYADNQEVAAGWKLWDSEVISDYGPNNKREQAPYPYSKIPTDNYQKIAQFIGPKHAEAITKLVDDFEDDFSALKIPEEPSGETVEQYTKRLRDSRAQFIRIATRDLAELYQAPLAATASIRETDARVDLHPPNIMHIRTFAPRSIPTTVSAPRKPSTGTPAPPKPEPKIILD